ncbi:hemolysin D [Iodidimonas gelatinilytica]|uniref:Hemolysin D n=1 Tax=Iodidimonas gelatinilytica TaxID=1236966 RepID=A0A5A7MMP7_9PROT|nr:efflux RND transporter periplasmic adaptor subunit [Iodidimonas gelatinilytica]GEQ96924.1 hemolysin D [Iodidimonas gelatinilytica]GER01072.1 hemolysin D [Iodidimonas gelatinilytica]
MKKSFLLAALITIVLVIWVLSGVLFKAPETETNEQKAQTPAQTAFSVRAQKSSATEFQRDLEIRGRTEAIRSVELQAEITGRVVETPVEKGQRVESGTIICRLSTEDRKANLAQAKALRDQRKLEYDAALELVEKGHRSATQLAQSKAEFEAAQAQLSQMQIALDNTEIRAPFAGLVDDRPAEIGDYLQQGGVCARLIDETPFLIVGEVSERDVGALSLGTKARVQIDGIEEQTGIIRYISATASERTRTFRVEVAIPNEDRSLRDGMTATIHVPLEIIRAHPLPPTALVLDADGRLGIRAAEQDGLVVFYPVTILSDAGDKIWVGGLPDQIEIITVGQEFVTAGQKVRTVLQPQASIQPGISQ